MGGHEMEAEHEAHLERILDAVHSELSAKYRKGQAEHGGRLWLKPGLLDMAIDEALDQVIYLRTLKEQLGTGYLIRWPNGVPATEVSVPFLQGMANRMATSFLKYGAVADAYPKKVDAVGSLLMRLIRYLGYDRFRDIAENAMQMSLALSAVQHRRETGNTEYLMDAANFCVAPNARVWMGDLSWRPAGDVVVGDQIIAFTENPETRRTQRSWRRATVLSVEHIELPRCRVMFSDGSSMVVSHDHRWLAVSAQGSKRRAWNYHWLTTGGTGRDGMRQHKRHFVPRIAPVVDPRADYSSGWVAGVLDGEGHANQSGGRVGGLKVMWAQNPGVVNDRMRSELMARGYDIAVCSTRKCETFGVRGGIAESLRLLQEVRPVRLISSLNPDKWGAVRQTGVVEVVAVEDVGAGPVIAIGTTTGTFVADGFGHHNCMIEFMHPRNPDAHFTAEDSAASPGRAWHTGHVGQDANTHANDHVRSGGLYKRDGD